VFSLEGANHGDALLETHGTLVVRIIAAGRNGKLACGARFHAPATASSREASGLEPGYTIGMKTAVSLPDDVYHGAERYAKRTRKSRSQLYAEALAEYLARHAPDEVTEDMNAVVEQVQGARPDPFVAGAARQILEGTEW
jgi:hypothetical protein